MPLSPLGFAALTYAVEFGLPVFPLTPRAKKPPLTKNGYLDASTHPEQVCAWWDRWPDANIGAVPGALGLVVLDLDGPVAEAQALEMGLLDVPTATVRTTRGSHLYFALPRGVTIGNSSALQPYNIDVRAHSGYVVLPPSVHETGHVYAWEIPLE
jgi:hypothetical protein